MTNLNTPDAPHLKAMDAGLATVFAAYRSLWMSKGESYVVTTETKDKQGFFQKGESFVFAKDALDVYAAEKKAPSSHVFANTVAGILIGGAASVSTDVLPGVGLLIAAATTVLTNAIDLVGTVLGEKAPTLFSAPNPINRPAAVKLLRAHLDSGNIVLDKGGLVYAAGTLLGENRLKGIAHEEKDNRIAGGNLTLVSDRLCGVQDNMLLESHNAKVPKILGVTSFVLHEISGIKNETGRIGALPSLLETSGHELCVQYTYPLSWKNKPTQSLKLKQDLPSKGQAR